jgi:two-component system response regulator HydG
LGFILVVDDEAEGRQSLAMLLRSEGHRVHESAGSREACEYLRTRDVDAVISDVRMQGDDDGFDLLRRARADAPDVPVILFTGFGSVPDAVDALKTGAYDYLIKPVEPDHLLHVVRTAIAHRPAAARAKRPDTDTVSFSPVLPPGVLTDDAKTKAVFARAMQIAHADIPVLILGESGTGKELLARAIHQYGARRNGPFVPLNCGAVPEGLVESELFGHRKGAFTHAIADKRGVLQEADGGVLFLDEVGDMPQYVQVRLLRFLDNGELRPIGDTALRTSNARVIAATNRPIAEDARAGRFRDDLFYRLGISLHMPPLRERSGDVLLLAEHFLERIATRLDLPISGFAPDVIDLLRQYSWPGNVRELKSAIEGAAVIAARGRITRTHLPAAIVDAARQTPDWQHQHEARERERVMQALRESGGHHGLAARALGVNRTTLWRRMRRLKIE